MLPTNYLFNNRWEAKSFIGKGAFSEIYAAEDTKAMPSSNSMVAIKVQSADFDAALMKWEAHVMRELREMANAPLFYFTGYQDNRHYIVMELLRGGEDMGNVRNRARAGSSSGLVPVPLAVYLARVMLNSLMDFHARGFIHRDVKPSNFMRKSRNSTSFCIIDFGLAKEYRAASFHGTPLDAPVVEDKEAAAARFRGTTVYASPFAHMGLEQCPRDDLFSVLHVLLDMIFGDLPWREPARNKDKEEVLRLKQFMLADMGAFIDELVVRTRATYSANKARVDAVEQVARAVKRPLSDFLGKIKDLKYADRPDYKLLEELLLSCVSEEERRSAEAISYVCEGFSWAPASATKPGRPSSSRPSSGGGAGRNDGTEVAQGTRLESDDAIEQRMQSVLQRLQKLETERIHTDHQARSDHLSGSRLSGGTIRPSSGNGSGSEAFGSAMSSTFGIRNSNSSISGAQQQHLQMTKLSIAVRWKNIVEDVLRLPLQRVPEEVMRRLKGTLEACDCFFRCNLGADEERNWRQLVEVQKAVAQFYDAYEKILHPGQSVAGKSKARWDEKVEAGAGAEDGVTSMRGGAKKSAVVCRDGHPGIGGATSMRDNAKESAVVYRESHPGIGGSTSTRGGVKESAVVCREGHPGIGGSASTVEASVAIRAEAPTSGTVDTAVFSIAAAATAGTTESTQGAGVPFAKDEHGTRTNNEVGDGIAKGGSEIDALDSFLRIAEQQLETQWQTAVSTRGHVNISKPSSNQVAASEIAASAAAIVPSGAAAQSTDAANLGCDAQHRFMSVQSCVDPSLQSTAGAGSCKKSAEESGAAKRIRLA